VITPAEFIQDFPAFSDQTRFPTSLIQFWLNFIYTLINPNVFDTATVISPTGATQFDMVAELYCAHEITLERAAMDQGTLASATGAGTPTGPSGVITSKSGDKLSASYDTTVASEEGAGYLNLTIYGKRIYRLFQLFGAGPIQSNVGSTPPFVTGAWIGPPPWPGWFG
jgi:hypothetical protein